MGEKTKSFKKTITNEFHTKQPSINAMKSNAILQFRNSTKSWNKIEHEFQSMTASQGSYSKFIYSEKATKFCEISTLLLTGTT